MKHFIFLTLFGAITIMSNAGDGNTTVIPMSQPTNAGNNRNQIPSPEVTYSSEEGAFTVSFEANETYYLEVKDAVGVTLYYSPIVTNGIEYTYQVNLPQNELYVISITSTNKEFTGILISN
ncbi:MAG: hypothetical protein II453_03405 [Alphaproteobacteria bacterium]|nr:hypothetical protein [Alphaproteobacteria bacterium]